MSPAQKTRLNSIVPSITVGLLFLSSFAILPVRPAHHPELASTAYTVGTADALNGHPSVATMSNNQVSDKDAWRTVQVFTGQDNDVTPVFRVSGTEWCLIWNIEPTPPPGTTFKIHIIQRDKPYALWQVISDTHSSGKRVFPIETENGEDFFLKVFAPNLVGWTVTVQDNYLTVPRLAIEISHIHYKGRVQPRGTVGGRCDGWVCDEIIEPDEYVVIRNADRRPQRMGGWKLTNITKGYPTFTFPADFVLDPGQTVLITTSEVYPNCGSWLEFGTRAPYCGKQLWLSFYFGPGDIWDNKTPDTAVLYDSVGKEVARKSYTVVGD